MIIQTTHPAIGPAMQPDARVGAPQPVRPVADTPAASAPRPPSAEEVKAAVATINRALQASNRSLEFTVDDDTHRTVVKMVDTSTGEVLRQFPSEETLAISRGIEQFQQGLLLKHKA
ncbi:flagellar protein FlaG [Thiobacillus sedimenti]|uniref:Flagellar protein FlaG n=1 Tax=Thiobacillus sedimenti TaxID=3110231 RepID=A0ABZ1CMZ7_9PROT|nr:flagellar protein FlaG [Thiobacillus sp. SCUT-2]WRS40270.1 flagellar protein FlaG [Thiobacillus sp. SCUT-2]